MYNLSGRQQYKTFVDTNTQVEFKTRHFNRLHSVSFVLLLLLLLKPLPSEKVNDAPLYINTRSIDCVWVNFFSNKIKREKKTCWFNQFDCARYACAMWFVYTVQSVYSINTHRLECLIRVSHIFFKDDNCIHAPLDRFK